MKKKYSDDDKSPVKSFIFLEKTLSIKLIQTIDENMRAIHGFISGTMLLSQDIKTLLNSLIQQQVTFYRFENLKCKIKFSKICSWTLKDTGQLAGPMGWPRRPLSLLDSCYWAFQGFGSLGRRSWKCVQILWGRARLERAV